MPRQTFGAAQGNVAEHGVNERKVALSLRERKASRGARGLQSELATVSPHSLTLGAQTKRHFPMANQWRSAEHALSYLQKADSIPHRTEGEATLLEEVPKESKRILDLGCGGGRLLDLLLLHCPGATGVALDFSPAMLQRLHEKYDTENRVMIVEHNLERNLPDLGMFDVVASSFAIHHLPHERKRELYQEVWQVLNPFGVFANLEHVSSPS